MTVRMGRTRIESDSTTVLAKIVDDRRWGMFAVGEGGREKPILRGRTVTMEEAVSALQLAEVLELRATASGAGDTWAHANSCARLLGLSIREAAAQLGFSELDGAPPADPAGASGSPRKWLRWLRA